jgi:hypothetical protein
MDESAAAAPTFGTPKPHVARPPPRRNAPSTRAPTPASREALLCSTGAFDFTDTFPVVRADLKDPMIIDVSLVINDEASRVHMIIERNHEPPDGT